MWRDECQLKMNDLVVACQASVDDYEQSAELAELPALAEWLRAVALYRQRLVPQLEEQVRELNDLPRMPDPEMQLLDQAVTRFKAALPTGGRQQVLEERREADEDMLALARSAQREALPKAALDILGQLITHLEATIETFRDLLDTN